MLSTMTGRSWSGSFVAARASPNRVSASRARPRSQASSSTRVSSWPAISLNACPRRANSSRPRTGTREPKLPLETSAAASASSRRERTMLRPSAYASRATRDRAMIEKRSSRRRRLAAAASIFVFGTSTASRVPRPSSTSAPEARYFLSAKVTVAGTSSSVGSASADLGPATTRSPRDRTSRSSFLKARPLPQELDQIVRPTGRRRSRGRDACRSGDDECVSRGGHRRRRGPGDADALPEERRALADLDTDARERLGSARRAPAGTRSHAPALRRCSPRRSTRLS